MVSSRNDVEFFTVTLYLAQPVSPANYLRADTFDDHCVHSPRAHDQVNYAKLS
jgi:hypothetical protein